MSTAGVAPNKNMLSGMDLLLTLSGDEFVEVVKQTTDGKFKNYRVLANKLKATTNAYDFAVANGFVGTLPQWLECTSALYARDPAAAGKVLVADNFGVGQWTEVGIGIVEGLQEELDLVLAEVRAQGQVSADAAAAAGQSSVQAVAAKNAAINASSAASGSATQAATSAAETESDRIIVISTRDEVVAIADTLDAIKDDAAQSKDAAAASAAAALLSEQHAASSATTAGAAAVEADGAKDAVAASATQALDARDSSEAFAINALAATGQAENAAIQAQQAELAAKADIGSLRTELTDPTNGAEGVKYKNPLTGAVSRSSRSKLTESFSALDAGLTAGSSDTLRAAVGNVDYSEPMMYGAHKRINGTGSTVSLSDEANFAGQALGTAAPIGHVRHHYTDGTMHQWDNVGDGTMLLMKNAHNPTRRPDKASDYVGKGIFVAFAEHDFAAGFSKTMAYISNKAEIVWTGVKGIATLWQNKADDGVWAFQYKTTNAHVNMLRFLNGVTSFLGIGNDVGFTRAFIKSDPSQTNGLYLESGEGDVTLGTLNPARAIRVLRPIRSTTGNLILGTVEADTAVEAQVPLKLRNYTTVGSLPSATTFAGCQLTYNGIPIYANGGVWKYIRDDVTVV